MKIARGFACLCSETVQGGCAAVKYHQQAGARGGSPKKRKLPADQSVGDSQGALPLSGAATSPRYLAFFAKLFFTWKITAGHSGDSQGALPLSGAATSPRYPAFFAKLFFTWKKSGHKERVRERGQMP